MCAQEEFPSSVVSDDSVASLSLSWEGCNPIAGEQMLDKRVSKPVGEGMDQLAPQFVSVFVEEELAADKKTLIHSDVRTCVRHQWNVLAWLKVTGAVAFKNNTCHFLGCCTFLARSCHRRLFSNTLEADRGSAGATAVLRWGCVGLTGGGRALFDRLGSCLFVFSSLPH